MSGMDCVRVIVDEILKGQILQMGEPLSFSGIAIVPIVRLNLPHDMKIRLSRTILKEYVHKVIVGSLPRNTCGVIVLDSLGDVVAFKIHMDSGKFWERISFVERLVMQHYKETRQPATKDNTMTRAVSFLRRLKNQGPEGIMSSEFDLFAISQADFSSELEDERDLFASTTTVLYAAGR